MNRLFQITLLMGLLLACAGCCTALLYEDAVEQVRTVGVESAYLHDGQLYITLGVAPEGEHYARASSRRVKRYHTSIPNDLTNSPLPVVRAPVRIEPEEGPLRNSVLWWIERKGKESYCHILYCGGEHPVSASMKMKYGRIPGSKYPRLMALTPLTVAVDVVTSPIQAGLFLIVWSIDWTEPYT